MNYINPVNKSFCLEQMCASNYQKLLKLVPELLALKEAVIGVALNNMPLHISVLENTPYTLMIELNHCFNLDKDEYFEPAVKIRLYMDAQLAEVMSDQARSPISIAFKDKGLSTDIMNYKWRLNYFLQKWLDHCLKQDYQFRVNDNCATID
ncbi:MAG: DUF1249 domain-containing protein [Methylococcales bacterium]|nr:MAG: DUF1249 domain-containing protein [Methylococcales bacterium]